MGTTTPPSSGARRRWPRQADIARVAGVSQATVSMVINDRDATAHRITESTRRRVWAAVEELGYVANPAARALAGGRSSLLGIYTFEPVFPVDFRDFYYPFLLGLEEEAEAQAYNLLLFTSASGTDRHRAIYRDGVNQLRAADGCVLLGRGGDRAELQRLVKEPFPVVFIGRRELSEGEFAYVGADYATATGQVVDHLASLGHTALAYLGWPDDEEPTLDRRHGFEAARERHGWPSRPQRIRRVAEAEVTSELITTLLTDGVTAIVAQDDRLAERARTHAEAQGRAIPRDLSIVVLGDPPRGASLDVDWSGFTIPRKEMGRVALRTLVELLDSDESSPRPQLLLPCTLHAGETTAPPA